MAPGSELIKFVLGKELKLIATKRFRQGHMWLCEKVRREAETCPKCATLSSTRFGTAWVLVRDEDLRAQPIWLKIKKHRYFCKACRKPFTEAVSGVWPRRKTTQRFRRRLLKDCDDFTNLLRVARKHFCSRSLVGRIFYEQMEINLRERRQIPWPRVVGIDEHFFKRTRFGTEFVTVFTDVHRRRMFEMALSKNKRSLMEQMAHIPGREKVEVVVMDLARGYNAFAKAMFPNAKIVADKFHVLRLLTPSLLKARREIVGHRQELGLRKKLLRSRDKLEYFECFDLDRYLCQHPKLAELYHFKERLHQLYRTRGHARARMALENLINEMSASSLPEVQRLKNTLRIWKEEVLEYFRSSFTNAFTEAMNGIAKLVQRRACGFRNFKNYRLRTLSACPL